MSDRLKDLFETALELARPQRDAWLAECCRDDDGMRDRLLELLAAHEAAGDFLEHPAELVAAVVADGDDLDLGFAPGDAVAGYELVERLGVGGFGSVWRARQRVPVVRDVALKIVHGEVAVGGRESQSLAAMRHPGVAKVFDAGALADGRAWLAMELVDGEPIDVWCRTRAVPLRERLRLFVEVCNALQHAHGKGVVHLDVKPNNVLVGERDGRAQPVVVDFGLARGTHVETGVREGQGPIGTPEYMSPEQAAGDLAAVDVRTDVYALGVLLYELAAGERPFVREPGTTGLAELLRRIREVAPEPPSRRATGRLPRELDWIVARALAKDPGDRYPSVASLADDVRRLLDAEPVSVGPRGAGYRLRCFVVRHRWAAATSLVAVSLALAGTLAALHGWSQAETGRLAAEAATQRAQRALALVENLWEAADPVRFGSADYPVRELFADFERLLPPLVAGDPAVELRVRLSMARVQRVLGSHDQAAVHADRAVALAVAAEDPDGEVQALLERARVSFELGQIPDAEAAVSTGLARLGTSPAPAVRANLHEVLANCRLRSGRPDDALAAAETAAAMRQELGEPLAIARSCLQLSNLHGSLGRVDLALAQLARAKATFATLDPGHPDRLVALQHEAALLQRQGDRAGAEPVLRECLDRRRALFGERNAHVAWTEADLGWLLHERGRHAEAEPLLRHALATLRERLGESHLYVSEAGQRLGAVATALGRFEEAEALLRAAADRYGRLPGHPVEGLVGCLGNLAALWEAKGEPGEAIELMRQAVQIARERLPADHFVVSVGMTNLAKLLYDRGERAEAAELLEQALRRSQGAGRRGEAELQRRRLVQILRELGRDDAAAQWSR